MSKNKITSNVIMLYGLNIAKIIFPFLTLPYLTRILSVESYGVVSYVKSLMVYMQVLTDFGFILSGTKDIVDAKQDWGRIQHIVSDILLARVILAFFAFFLLAFVTAWIPILRENALYTILSFVSVFLSCFLMDFFFRGIERMGIITIRFLLMKGISTLFTFVFVCNDQDLLWIPILDALGSFIAVILVAQKIHEFGICIKLGDFHNALRKLTVSWVYFISNMATTAFGALNTLLIGIFIAENEVAYWSVAMQIVSAVQTLYTPITDGVYPEMVRSKSFKIIFRVLKFFVPILVIGCVSIYWLADLPLWLVGGEKYLVAKPILRALIPVLLFSFPGVLFGWPALGAIGRIKETTRTTVVTAVVQVIGLFLLIAMNAFTLINIALLRGATELLMFLLRARYCWIYRFEFRS